MNYEVEPVYHRSQSCWSLLFTDQAIPWEYFSDGVEVYPLCVAEDGRLKAAFMRNEPGAVVPEHLHQGYEYILLLSGSESDAKNTYHAGDFIANPPNSSHQVTTGTGNMVLIIWEAPIQFK